MLITLAILIGIAGIYLTLQEINSRFSNYEYFTPLLTQTPLTEAGIPLHMYSATPILHVPNSAVEKTPKLNPQSTITANPLETGSTKKSTLAIVHSNTNGETPAPKRSKSKKSGKVDAKNLADTSTPMASSVEKKITPVSEKATTAITEKINSKKNTKKTISASSATQVKKPTKSSPPKTKSTPTPKKTKSKPSSAPTNKSK